MYISSTIKYTSKQFILISDPNSHICWVNKLSYIVHTLTNYLLKYFLCQRQEARNICFNKFHKMLIKISQCVNL